MANPAWNASGDYFETCTCDYLCPCLSSHLTAPPTKGECIFAFAFRVDRGRFADVSLDGLCFALAGVAPGAMGEGHWKVGLIVDERNRRCTFRSNRRSRSKQGLPSFSPLNIRAPDDR